MAYTNQSAKFRAYLGALGRPFRKVARLEFLQPDDSVAFALGGVGQRIPIAGRDTRTFLQDGSLSVAMQNGSRRHATVTLANADGAFDYAVNKLWFGQRVRLMMGLILPDGEEFYLPQGVFYIQNPSALISPSGRTISLGLTDKWAYLDGSLFGTLDGTYVVPSSVNIFSTITSLLRLSKFTYESTENAAEWIDAVQPVYTTYFNDKTYSAENSDGSITEDIPMTTTPFQISQERGSSLAALLLQLNSMLAGWIGYDATGTLRLEPSQDDIDDAEKAVLHSFSMADTLLGSLTETAQNGEVYNEVLIAGEGLTGATVWARAGNYDARSDTNINRIGKRLYTEQSADYWNTEQCAALARWQLKRKTILRKSVSVTCGQMFHLQENRLISIIRSDKPGNPVEKHLIQGFTLPVGESGSMTVNCVSVTDIPDYTITTSVSGDEADVEAGEE